MTMLQPPMNVLFLCTGNSARSLTAESMLNKDGEGCFRAWSAGSHPMAAPHPQALATLRWAEYPTEGLHPKSWTDFSGDDAPVMDFVFTVCDVAAGEVCPTWPGHPITAHWGVPDPADFKGSPAETATVFNDVLRMLRNRLTVFMALPFSSLDRLALEQRVRAIGAMARDPEAAEVPGLPSPAHPAHDGTES